MKDPYYYLNQVSFINYLHHSLVFKEKYRLYKHLLVFKCQKCGVELTIEILKKKVIDFKLTDSIMTCEELQIKDILE